MHSASASVVKSVFVCVVPSVVKTKKCHLDYEKKENCKDKKREEVRRLQS